MMTPDHEVRAAMLISGGGTTMEAILRARARGELDGIRPVAVIASRPDAAGIQKAKDLGYATYIVDRTSYENPGEYGQSLLTLLRELKVDLISQNGWLPKTPKSVVTAYSGRIINQHPGPLDPGRIDFGGKGMYGIRVSAARLGYAWRTADSREHWTEATMHRVTEEYDKGSLIAVSRLAIPEFGQPVTVAELSGSLQQSFIEGAHDLQDSLIVKEHQLVVDTLRTIGETRSIPLYTRSSPLIAQSYIPFVQEAKTAAIQIFPVG